MQSDIKGEMMWLSENFVVSVTISSKKKKSHPIYKNATEGSLSKNSIITPRTPTITPSLNNNVHVFNGEEKKNMLGE
jgi:hypothetical protein